ncbi:MAG TPA: site-specific integrase [Candidatus Rifleibacterium sp.]|nr:site-specific integrase [Candidatus Rifleibacterium sp.]HPT45903.1 site-specific integrase [Candidatus Rifleibacterium sp.]
MSTIFEKRGVWYYQFTINGKRRAKSLKTKDKQAAKRLQKLNDAKLEQRKLGLAPKNVKIAQALADLLDRKSQALKPTSLCRYKEMVRNLTTIPVEFAHKLTVDDLNDYIADRRKAGRANQTIHTELAILKAAIIRSCPRDQIETLLKEWPVIKKTIAKGETVDYYPLEDIEQLKIYFRGRAFERFFLFALYTGCRRSEVNEMRWSSVSLGSNTIRIRNIKTETSGKNQYRTISIHPGLTPVLANPGAPVDLVFPETQKHSRNWPFQQMELACRDCGIQYRRFHGLRHTTATYLLAAGVDLREVMQLMGWTRIETAQRYIHLAKAAADKMARLPY